MKKPFTHERWNDCSSTSLIHRATDEEQRELKEKEVEQIIKILSHKDEAKIEELNKEQLNLYLEKNEYDLKIASKRFGKKTNSCIFAPSQQPCVEGVTGANLFAPCFFYLILNFLY